MGLLGPSIIKVVFVEYGSRGVLLVCLLVRKSCVQVLHVVHGEVRRVLGRSRRVLVSWLEIVRLTVH